MATNTAKPTPPEPGAGWTSLPPAKLPKPGVWPVMLAMGITFLVWGLVTSLIITGVGAALFAGAMVGWIRDIRHERSKH